MKQLLNKSAITAFLIIAVLVQFGCKENVLINSKVSPSNNEVNVYSTALSCITHSYYSDSAVTNSTYGGIPIYQAVGSIYDPYFGTMTGSTYFQIVPSTPSSDTFSGQTIDSAVFVLPYSGFTYGDTNLATGSNITQTYQVFYMTDSLSSKETYYSNTTKAYNSTYPLSDPATVNIYHLKDSFGINALDANTAGLRIKLKLPLLKSLLFPAMQKITSTSTSPDQDFIGSFRGLHIRVGDSRKIANALPYFKLEGNSAYTNAGIIVYYHRSGGSTDSVLHQSFSFNSSYCSHFNNISRSYRGFPINNLLQSTNKNADIIALQNEPGASIDLVIPGIKSLPAGVLNKAELQLTLIPKYNDGTVPYNYLFAPERIYAVGVANTTYPSGYGQDVAYNLADRYPLLSTSPLLVMDGFVHTLSAGTSTRQTFTINIPREVMNSIAQKNDTLHLHISGTSDFYGAFHMVAGGGNYGVDGTTDTLYRAKLIVTYSKLSH